MMNEVPDNFGANSELEQYNNWVSKRREEAEADDRKKWELDVRVAYPVAANLYMQENAVTWARFNTMVAVNALIVTAVGIVAREASNLGLLAIILPFSGFLLCLIWHRMMMRGFTYHDVWRDSAYAIERKFSARVQTLHFADELRSNGATTIEVSNDDLRTHSTNGCSTRARTYAELVIYIFGSIYVLSVIQISMLMAGITFSGAPLRQ
jgi:hypothetical protein